MRYAMRKVTQMNLSPASRQKAKNNITELQLRLRRLEHILEGYLEAKDRKRDPALYGPALETITLLAGMPERPILAPGDAMEEEAEKYALLTLGSGAFGKWPGKPPGHEKDKQLSVLSEAPALPALLVEGDACQGGMIDNHNHQEPGEVNHGIMEEEAERNAPLTLGSGQGSRRVLVISWPLMWYKHRMEPMLRRTILTTPACHGLNNA